MFWIYALPTWLLALLFVGVVAGLTSLLHHLVRPRVRRHVASHHDWNHLLGHVLANHGVLYGVLLALVALATFENHADVEGVVNREAASLGALYRDVSSYPDPGRGELQASLRDYTRYIIEEEWPAIRRGELPAEGVERLTAFQQTLVAFEPATKGQEFLHAEALREFNQYVEARRERLHNATTGLPAVWWWVVVFGALVGFLLLAGYQLESAIAHFALALTLNLLVGLIIFLLAVTDHPLRGGVRISAEAFEVERENLMTPESEPPSPR